MILSPVILYPLSINLGLLVPCTVPWDVFFSTLSHSSQSWGAESLLSVKAITQKEGSSLNVF